MLDKLFNHIDLSVDWGLLFGLISVLSLVFAWIIKTFRTSNKEVSVREAFIEKLQFKPEGLQNNLKILLNGTEIEQLNKVSLFLKNSGISTLNSEDFHILPTVNLSGYTDIISFNVSSSNEFIKCETLKVGHSILEFRLGNYEPKDFIRVEIFFESLSNEFEFTFEYRLKENKKMQRDLKRFSINKHFQIEIDQNRFFIILFFPALIVFGLSYFIVQYGLKVDLSDLKKFSNGWKVLFFIPTILTAIYVFFKWNHTKKDFYDGHLKIKKWYSLTSNNKL